VIKNQALRRLLLALADDEFILGYRDSEWTGIAPLLEEDVALSSMSQDEIGHARFFFEMLEGDSAKAVDALALGRQPNQYTHCRLVERPRGDWSYSMARQFLYDAAESVRLDMLAKSSFVPLALGTAKILREEKYHRMHGESWMNKLAQGSEESRSRLEKALAALWPDMGGFFEPVEGEDELLSEGILCEPFAALIPTWWGLVGPVLEKHKLAGPAGGLKTIESNASFGGRRGQHSDEFQSLWEEMTMVYRSDPEAVW
jgi:ring-1,2-phenylacetyl-CoA epoxidase subunit PaaC